MNVNDIFLLLGGLGLFLYGINLMSEGLKLIAGNRLKRIVENLTTNKWLGAFIGLSVTAIIQSSTATTVMVVGFVNASLMNIYQAAGVIIGANVGTTFTGLLFVLNLNDIAPFVIFLGAFAALFMKRKEFKHTGMILLGFGILFLGLNLMSTSVVPLRDSVFILSLFEYTRNPIVGLLVGFAVVAIIQSSTASLGILLIMMTSGIVTDLDQAIFILYGLNLGGVVTAVIASLGSSKAAKQAAAVNVIFNAIGAIIFTIITILPFGLTDFIRSLTDTLELQLVYAHIIYNVANTIFLLPFSVYIVKAAKRIVPDDPNDINEFKFKYIDNRLQGTPSLAVEQTVKEVTRMANIAYSNYIYSVAVACENPKSITANKSTVEHNEEVINYLKQEINKYLMKLNTTDLSDQDIKTINSCYKIVGYLERIGDLSLSSFIALEQYTKNKDNYTSETRRQLKKVANLCKESLTVTINLLESEKYSEVKANHVKELKEQINYLNKTDQYLINDLLIIRVLNNIARISGHSLNITRNLKFKEKDHS